MNEPEFWKLCHSRFGWFTFSSFSGMFASRFSEAGYKGGET